jgi:hypothetical protein
MREKFEGLEKGSQRDAMEGLKGRKRSGRISNVLEASERISKEDGSRIFEKVWKS